MSSTGWAVGFPEVVFVGFETVVPLTVVVVTDFFVVTAAWVVAGASVDNFVVGAGVGVFVGVVVNTVVFV